MEVTSAGRSVLCFIVIFLAPGTWLYAHESSTDASQLLSDVSRDQHVQSENEERAIIFSNSFSSSTDDHTHDSADDSLLLNILSNSLSAADSSCGNSGEDGEGCGSINTDYLVAGSTATFNVLFTAGSSGIPIGGGISIGFHHASNWPMQVTSPNVAGYTSIGSDNAGKFQLELH